MGKATVCFLLLVTVLLIYSVCCTPISLQPFYSDEDVIFEPALLGNWIDDCEDLSRWSFTESDEDHYWLRHSEYEWDESSEKYVEQRQQQFYVHLFKLGDSMFFDMFPDVYRDSSDPARNIENINQIYDAHCIRGHTLWLVIEIGPELAFTPLNLDPVEEYLAEHPDAVASDRWGFDEDTGEPEGTALLGTTAELQAFLGEYLPDPAAFDEGDPFFSLVRESESEYADEIAEPDVEAFAQLSVIAMESGEPQGCLIQIFTTGGVQLNEFSTDMQGLAYMPNFAPGKYVLKFVDREGSYYPAEVVVELEPGEQELVEVELLTPPDAEVKD